MKTNPLRGIGTVLGRVMLALIFLMSAIGNKIPNFNDVAGYMASEGVPFPQVMLVGAIVFLIGGSLSIILGFKARLGAGLLLVFLVLATYFFHDFWTWPENAMWVLSLNSDVQMPVQQIEMISFMKNMALMGAMLFIMSNGSGPWSLDNKRSNSTGVEQ
jgi:putative oxidoreductase